MTHPKTPSGPESIVTSLDWSKKLHGCGWSHTTYFDYWEKDGDPVPFVWDKTARSEWATSNHHFYAHAPTAEEVLRRLPQGSYESGWSQFFAHAVGDGAMIRKEGKLWCVYRRNWRNKQDNEARYEELSKESGDPADEKFREKEERQESFGDTLANAAAAMYCYLAENNLLPTL